MQINIKCLLQLYEEDIYSLIENLEIDRTWHSKLSKLSLSLGIDFMDSPCDFEAIELARKYVKQYSYREVANWLTKKTARVISHVGLRKRLMHEQQRKNKARTLRKWSEYAQKAIEKAKAIEEERTGARA